MSQYNIGIIDPGTMSGSALAAALNALIPAIESNHKGAMRPSYVAAGMLWIDDSGSDWLLKMFDGVQDIVVATVDPAAHALIAEYLRIDAPQVLTDLQKAALQAALGVPSTALVSTKASLRNRMLNPAFQICQDRALGATIQVSNGAGYAFDGVVVTASGAALLTYSQVAKVTPGGSPYRLRGVVTTAAAVGAGNYYEILLPIEGADVADLRQGTPQAKTLCWRMVVNMPAGTYAVVIANGDGSRSFVQPFAISVAEAGTDKLISGIVPGCVDGTWIKDTSGRGLLVRIVLASGADYQTATPGAWVTSAKLATAAISNNLPVGAVYEVADVGLYAGAALPDWEMPAYADDLARCQRRWWRATVTGVGFRASSEVNGNLYVPFQYPVIMPVAPALSVTPNSGAAEGENAAHYFPAFGSFARVTASAAILTGGLPAGVGSTANVPWRTQFEVIANARI